MKVSINCFVWSSFNVANKTFSITLRVKFEVCTFIRVSIKFTVVLLYASHNMISVFFVGLVAILATVINVNDVFFAQISFFTQSVTFVVDTVLLT